VKKYNLLVVEDDALIAANLVHTLSSLGFAVREPVATGQDAISAVKNQQPDLVLMDIELLGEMDGIETAEKIRAIADIPIVYLTAYSDDLRIKQARITEPYGYIVKPAHNRELYATIEMALYKHELDRKLKENEEKYRVVADFTYGWEFWIAPDGKFTYVSPSCERITGYRPEEFMCDPNLMGTISHNDDRDKIIDHLAITQELKTGHDTLEFRIITRNGEERWIGHDCQPVYNINGEYLGRRGSNRDITERKRVEEALCESEDRFRQLFSRMPSAVAIYDGVDGGEDFIIKDFNAAAEKIEGIKKDDIIGKRVTQVFPGVRDFGIFAVFQRVWRTGQFEFFPSALYRDERDPGTWRENWVYKLANGEVIAIYHDITERKQAEEALRASEMKYRDIFEKSVSGLFKTSIGGHLIDTNDALAHMYGYSDAAEMLKADPDIGTHFYANPDDRKEVLRILAEKGMVENHEILHSKRDGTHFWGLITARTVRNEDGTVLFFEGSNTDISERKFMEEALRQANKKLNLLSSITRHDINNQLTSANGFLELLHRKVPDPTLEDYFTRVIKANSRISAIIQFTREYEQIGIKAPVWQDCRILADTAAKQAPLGKVTVKNDLPAGMEVFADPLVVKVCYNLMDNAARYGGKITTIRFFGLEHGDDQIIVCEDDGVGIPADEKEKIFGRGFGKNTGMGLFLSREILDITGITITETGEPGKGARFEIRVPKGTWRIGDTRV
jgi:PAS domain S-box-containing protein